MKAYFSNLFALTLLSFTFVACAGSSEEPLEIVNTSFKDCSQLEAHLSSLSEASRRAYSVEPTSQVPASQSESQDAFNNSNLNGGLEEGDSYKISGNKLIVLDVTNQMLQILNIEDPAAPSRLAEVDLNENKIQAEELLLLSESDLVVIGRSIESITYERDETSDQSLPEGGTFTTFTGMAILHFVITESEPTLVDRIDTTSYYSTARVQENGNVKLVHSSYANLGSVNSDSGSVQLTKQESAEILAETLGAKKVDSKPAEQLCSCDRFLSRDSATSLARPSVATTHIHNLRIEEGKMKLVHDISFVGTSPSFRATSEAFLFGFPIYQKRTDESLLQPISMSNVRGIATDVVLALDASSETQIVAETQVEGGVLNQFGMDYRVVGGRKIVNIFTTRPETDARSMESLLTTLEAGAANSFKVLNKITGLGPDESLFANSFTAQRAYAVTSTVIHDPLFVIDMSQPAKPVLQGSLEVDGFATQIREISSQRLFTVGRDENAAPYVGLVRVDGSGLPSLEDRIIYGGQNDYSAPAGFAWFQSESSYKAYNYDSEAELLALPVSAWSGGTNSAKFFQFGATSIDELGSIDSFTAPVERIIQISDHYYSISSEELVVSTKESPASVLLTLSLSSD